MNFPQILAGNLAVGVVDLYGVSLHGHGPFRAIRREALDRLMMREETDGWNLEMQMKAARGGLLILVSAVIIVAAPRSFQVFARWRGSFVAGTRIIATLLRVAFETKTN